jgi:type I site-specific restriction endonuclease
MIKQTDKTKELISKVKSVQKLILTCKNIKHKQQLQRELRNLYYKIDGSGRITCWVIKGKTKERSSKEMIKSACSSQKNSEPSFNYTRQLFDWAKIKKK